MWPRKPDDFVPFNSGAEKDKAEAENLWQKEKEAYLDTLRKKDHPTDEEKERYELLQPMTYEQFKAQYLDDRLQGEAAPYGAGQPYVGHVAIVQLVQGKPMIIEAVIGQVRRISYDEWLKDRSGELIWWGRLKDIPRDERATMAERAAGQIGKPYDFWNLNLLDTSGFYCSKLVWYSTWSAIGVALDDNRDPDRSFWYSPKRLMRSPHLEVLANPDSYGQGNPAKETPQ